MSDAESGTGKIGQTIGDWAGAIAGKRDDAFEHTVIAVVGDVDLRGGFSWPIQVLVDDGRTFWLKRTTGPGNPRALVTEQVVARSGKLIGAPVCEVAVLLIPESLAGEPIGGGELLQPGLAHGSLDVANSDFHKGEAPNHTDKDDNRRRQLAFWVLYDWFWGNDPQWLHDLGDDFRTYSHDHGMYFPDGPDWTAASLTGVDSAQSRHSFPRPDAVEGHLAELITQISSITTADLAAILENVPASWPVTDRELEMLGWFLQKRLEGVLTRLRASV